MSERTPADNGGARPPGPGLLSLGAIDAALGALGAGVPPGGTGVNQDAALAKRVLRRLRLLAVTVCPPAFLAGGISQAVHGPVALDVSGMLLFSTGMTGGGLGSLLACWRPARWVPGLRQTVNRCCIFGIIPAIVLLGAGYASSAVAGGGRLTRPSGWLSFRPR